MDIFRCSHCGFETPDKGKFIRTNSDGDHVWLEMCCPQCCFANPRVGPVGESPFKGAEWGLETTGSGLYIWARGEGKLARHSAPMIPDHQLASASASLLIPGESGTMMDLHRRLREQGETRAKAFHAEIKEIDRNLPEAEAEVDAARKRNLVGPYDPRKTFDGPPIQRRAFPGRWDA